MRFFQEKCWVVVAGCQQNKSCSKVSDFLERLDDRIRCTHEETVAVVKAWEDTGSNKSLGCIFSEKPADRTISLCSIFVYPKQCYGCQCLRFLMCAQMLMHVIAHSQILHKRVCTKSLTLGEKSLAALGTQTRVSIAPVFSVGCSTHWAITTQSF